MATARPRQSLLIATPTIDGNLHVSHVESLLRSSHKLRQLGIPYEISYEVGNSIVSDARNQLVSRFLQGKHSDLLFIDADIAWNEDDLARLLGWDVPLVAGAYRRKQQNIDFTVKFGPTIDQRKGLMVAERVGTGFLRIRRTVFEQMAQRYPELQLKFKGQRPAEQLYAFFDNSIVDGRYVGEDFTFCDRWRRIGGEVLVDPMIQLRHIGSQAYEGRLIDYLQPKRDS